ncbi:hypothetical protein CDAR_50861 [Caerostris darwini]|uniref:Uncharacterized protein n=1 Tax=Caerostris darwini TaxID=1538125 RepID=A0AAV4U5U7_9ARAC|nr:hypothetical protein CDAR_50861 [Caerostris darwini]
MSSEFQSPNGDIRCVAAQFVTAPLWANSREKIPVVTLCKCVRRPCFSNEGPYLLPGPSSCGLLFLSLQLPPPPFLPGVPCVLPPVIDWIY